MSDSEWGCEGGEVAFIGRLYADSLRWRRRIRWFTSMCGKKETLKHWRSRMTQQQHSADPQQPLPLHWRSTTFEQGRQARWALAWSWWQE